MRGSVPPGYVTEQQSGPLPSLLWTRVHSCPGRRGSPCTSSRHFLPNSHLAVIDRAWRAAGGAAPTCT